MRLRSVQVLYDYIMNWLCLQVFNRSIPNVIGILEVVVQLEL